MAGAPWASDSLKAGLRGWQTISDTPTQDTVFGTHIADLDTEDLVAGGAVVLTFYWRHDQRWEGTDYRLDIV